jgi:DNA-binding GntR family transcriptional regulator
MADQERDSRSYVDITAALARRIRSGEYPAGAKLPTETELAAEFGCGTDTAAKALRLLQRYGLAMKVFRRGYFSFGPDDPLR